MLASLVALVVVLLVDPPTPVSTVGWQRAEHRMRRSAATYACVERDFDPITGEEQDSAVTPR